MITAPRHARHAKSGRTTEPRTLIYSTADPDAANAVKTALASALVTLSLAKELGVFVAPCDSWWGVWLGRHDGQALEPTPAVLALRDRMRR